MKNVIKSLKPHLFSSVILWTVNVVMIVLRCSVFVFTVISLRNSGLLNKYYGGKRNTLGVMWSNRDVSWNICQLFFCFVSNSFSTKNKTK